MIEEEHGRRPVRAMCEALGVTPSAYYAWRSRPESERERSDRSLLVKIRARRLKRRPPTATPATPLTPVAVNVLDRAFESSQPDRVWAADMTYIATGEGWLYLSVVLDLHSRRVVGWSAQPSLSRRGLVEALTSAIRARRPEPGLVYHSDQGSQYTSDKHRSLLRRHGLVASMSRRGKCLDNAPAESFFASLKSDLIRGRHFATHAEARAELFDYIETFYNRRRRHSSLGYLTPAEYEERHLPESAKLLAV